jgi:hypothetical protein
MQVNKFSLDFCDIVCNYNPYFASLRGIEKAFMPDYSYKNIRMTVDKLESLLKKLERCENSKEKQTLYDSIKTMIFFINRRVLWNNPLYYIEKAYQLISVCWSNYGFLKDEVIDLNVLSKRVMQLPSFFKQAIINLETINIAKLDCIYVVKKLEEFKLSLLKTVNKFIDFPKEEIYNSTAEFGRFLLRKKNESRAFTNPMGEDLIKYLHNEIGLVFNSNNLYNKILALIEKFNVEDYREQKNIYFQEDLTITIKKIFESGEEWFGGSSYYINNIIYKENNSDIYDLNYLEYVPSPPLYNINDNINEGIFLYTNKFIKKNKYSHILGLIHEVYPGHHFITQKYRENNRGKLSIILYENIAFSEGWAKFCEFVYAKKIFNDKEYILNLSSQIVKMALLGLASIELHIKKTSYDETIKSIQALYSLPANLYKSLLLQSYLYPIDCISTVLGFIYFIERYDLNSLHVFLNEIYTDGPLIMKGKEL